MIIKTNFPFFVYNVSMRILSVGSTVIDLFLTPDITPPSTDEVTLKLGQKIPTDFNSTSVGGNAANVAVVLKRLGQDSQLYTYLAKDFLSREIEKGLEKEGIEPVVEKIKGKSDFSLVLTIGNERVIFSHHDKCPHGFNYTRITPDIIYLNSIGHEWESAYKKVLEYVLEKNIQLALSPGSHQLNDLSSTLYETLEKTTIFFSNVEEAKKIVNKKFSNTNDTADLFSKLHSLGPKIVSITDGDKGSYASDGKKIFKLGVVQDKYIEKTGAGDTYSASFLAWYTETKDIKEAMRAGALNASAVMKKIGAHEGILTKKELNKDLDERKDFVPQPI